MQIFYKGKELFVGNTIVFAYFLLKSHIMAAVIPKLS